MSVHKKTSKIWAFTKNIKIWAFTKKITIPAACSYWRWGGSGRQENINAICILGLNIVNDKVSKHNLHCQCIILILNGNLKVFLILWWWFLLLLYQPTQLCSKVVHKITWNTPFGGRWIASLRRQQYDGHKNKSIWKAFIEIQRK